MVIYTNLVPEMVQYQVYFNFFPDTPVTIYLLVLAHCALRPSISTLNDGSAFCFFFATGTCDPFVSSTFIRSVCTNV